MKTIIKAHKGFTLIELMIVVAIIGILAAIAIPKFADLISKSKEGATKGGLSAVRGALQVYYGDNEGWFPVDNLNGTTGDNGTLTTNAKYIKEVPIGKLPGTGHPDKSDVITYSSMTAGSFINPSATADTGGWAYGNLATNSQYWGEFKVNCYHYDIKGTNIWTSQ